MSSNQWELVTKSKKQKNLEKKVGEHTEQKRIAAMSPKLEELWPSNQYQSIKQGELDAKEKPSPIKSKSKSPKKISKTNLKEQTIPNKKPKQTKLPAKPKSLEIAMRTITLDDFTSQVEQLKLTCPGSELRWLSGIASYFNSNLVFDTDPTFSGKSVNYPSILANAELRDAVIQFLQSVGVSNLEYFFYSLLDSMASELNNNLPTVGYKFMLQLIGQNWPNLCSINMAKTALLRNSYQNRSNIGLSILWAIGQGGYKILMEGIKVWQNLMLPNLEMKSYTTFIVQYIEKVLNTAPDGCLDMNQNDFFLTYNALTKNYNGMAKEHQQSLKRSAALFLQKYIASSTKHSNIFLTLFREIESPTKQRTQLDGCLSCLLRGGDSFKVWKMNYKKQLVPSILLLQAIVDEWDRSAFALFDSESFHNFMLEAEILNNELDLAKRRDPNVDDLIAAYMSVQEKSAVQKQKQNAAEKKKCGCCKWVLGSILLIGLIGGLLCYDTQVNGKGSFEKSSVGNVLKNAGMLPHVQKVWYTTMSASARGYKWAEKHVPPYAKPAGRLACDCYKLARNTACNVCSAIRQGFESKWPEVAKFIDQYMPGLSIKLEGFATAIKLTGTNLVVKSVAFFKTQVLVGPLSPDNLSKAMNDTQNAAIQYLNLFHKKVDAYAKLK